MDFKPFAGMATESSIVLLRKIIKLLEPSGFRDSAGRQRVTIDNSPTVVLGAGAAAIGSVTVSSGTITSTFSSMDTIDRRQFQNQARSAYNGLRSNLKFNSL